jgi:ABC-type cobalamin transport system permease subunit
VMEFRIATLLLGASMVVPMVVQLFLVGNPLGSPRQPGVGQGPGTAMYAMAISPLLSMLAVILGVYSVTPRSQNKDA